MAKAYQAKVTLMEGAAELRAQSGGKITVQSGGTIDVESGGALKIAGTTVSATAAELNKLNASTAGTAVASKALVLGTNKDVDEIHVATLYLGTTAGTACTATATELNQLHASTAGTAVASKAAVLGANKNLDELHLAALYLGADAGTAVSATAAELNKLNASTAGVAVASKAAVLGANKNLDELHLAALYLGADAGTAISPTAAQINVLVQGTTAGLKLARGTAAVTGTLDVNTGLATVVAAAATLGQDPTITCAWVSIARPGTAGYVTLKTWQPTATNNVTPTAGTTTSAVVEWLAVGT